MCFGVFVIFELFCFVLCGLFFIGGALFYLCV